jgi:ribonuclease HI
MKKGVPFKWDQACQNAFEDIKKYLSSPPILSAPVKGKPLILYTAAMPTSLGALLAQNNDDGKEVALYYLSRTLLGAECNYPDIEKICLALVFATQKLRHYMLEHTIHLVSRADPLRHILSKMTLSGRLAKWAMFLSQFDIVFVPQKAVKGQALANFLAAHPIPDDFPIDDDLPDEEVFTTTVVQTTWQMYFDGACRKSGAGAGVIFVTPDKAIIPYSFTLTSAVSNNAAEYEALIIGLEIAYNMGLNTLHVYGDSQLVINQLLGTYAVKKEGLVPYFRKAKELMTMFADIKIQHVIRNQNEKADALASLAASLALGLNQTIDIHVEERRVLPILGEEESTSSTSSMTVDACEIEAGDWRTPFLEYLLHGYLPLESAERSRIRKRSINYTCINDMLYRRSSDGILLRCLAGSEVIEALNEVHAGVCGAHQSGPKLHYQLRHLGYYWPTMFDDSMKFAKRCHQCQIHGNFIHQPHEPLHPTNMSWPFEMWGMDVVGPINPPSSKGHKFILAATDYFSKWAEAVPLKEVKAENVEDFIRTNLIYRFGVPARIISDNGPSFRNKYLEKMCAKFKIKHHFSTGYNPAANGQAEAFNKVLCKLLKKVVSQNKRNWHEKLLESLWAYRTTTRTATGMTPYSLVYGGEAVLPLEVQIASLRVAIHENLTEDEAAEIRFEELDGLEEKRLHALQKLEAYQARVSRAFDKRLKRRSFKQGDLVLAVIRPMNVTHRMQGKFEPKWEGPYIIKDVYSSGAYRIISPDGEYCPPPVNGKFLKRYYA